MGNPFSRMFNAHELASALGVSPTVFLEYLAAFEKVTQRMHGDGREPQVSQDELLGVFKHARVRVQGGETVFQAMIVAATSLVW
jgi:hypothetical protein